VIVSIPGEPEGRFGESLAFLGPFAVFSDEQGILPNCPVQDRNGIYLWAVKVGLEYRITYVGETASSFLHRVTQHVHHCVDGYERISSASALLEGRQEILWDGLWRKDRRGKLADFVRDAVRLVAAAKEELLIHRLFLAPSSHEQRILRRIEGAIAAHLRADAVAGSLMPSDVRYHTRTADEAPMLLRLAAPTAILGLPSEIVV